MAGHTLDFVFYVQAGARIGMGHLSRAWSVMSLLQNMGHHCSLYLDADSQGVAKARDWGLTIVAELPPTESAVVIDALTVDDLRVEALWNYSPRILISPTFNRVDVVSHALLRNATSDFMDKLPDSAVLHVDKFYSFATSNGLYQHKLNFEKLEIGLCLSGGLDPLDPASLLDLLEGLDQVDGIRIIDPRCPTSCQKSLRHVKAAEQPWEFFDGINLFIGGEGVMLAEAISQGFPTFSLSSPRNMSKNAALEESGALIIIKRDDKMLSTLAAFLDNKASLRAMHIAALKLDGAANANRLAIDIQNICEEDIK